MITFPELQKVLARQLRIKDPETIRMESKIMKDLGADSLDILQLLMKLEDNYGYAIPDDKLAKFETVGDVMAYIESQDK